jgi:hypothetical protein
MNDYYIRAIQTLEALPRSQKEIYEEFAEFLVKRAY